MYLTRVHVRIARADQVGELGRVLALEHEVDELVREVGRAARPCGSPCCRRPSTAPSFGMPCRIRNLRPAACASRFAWKMSFE